jgi:hypothetical protein
VGIQSEYIRDGLVWDTWTSNVDRVLRDGNLEGFHMMCTVNALCLDSLPEFLNQCLEWKDLYGRDYPTFSLNILRFPSFQSPLVLPDELRTHYREQLAKFYKEHKNNKLLHQFEINQLQRLIDYLDVVITPHSGAMEQSVLQRDFKNFYQQYDQRRGKNFTEAFPKLADWYNEI